MYSEKLRTLQGPLSGYQKDWLSQKATEALPKKLHSHFFGGVTFDVRQLVTMGEFVLANQDWHGRGNKYLVCHKPENEISFPVPTLFRYQAHTTQILQILRNQGFDFVTTKILLPKVLKAEPHISVGTIGVELFLRLPLQVITGMPSAATPSYSLHHLLEEIENKVTGKILIEDIIKVEPQHIDVFKYGDQRRRVNKMMNVIQDKLRQFAFDHPFMEREFIYAKEQAQ